jgi:TatA/E family protein of Tat protein translocase
MFNVGPLELMVLLVLALIVFGPARLPELMGSVGRAIREFQQASRDLTAVFHETQQEFTSALDLDAAVNESGMHDDATQSADVAATVEPAEQPASTYVAPGFDWPASVNPRTMPTEYATAASMLDPVEPYPRPVSPANAELPEWGVPDTAAMSNESAAALTDVPSGASVADAAISDAAGFAANGHAVEHAIPLSPIVTDAAESLAIDMTPSAPDSAIEPGDEPAEPLVTKPKRAPRRRRTPVPEAESTVSEV